MSAGYLFPEMPAAGDRIPKRLARPLSAKAMAARFKQHLEHWGRGTLPSMRLGCVAPSHRLSQVDIADIMAAVNWKSEKIAGRYVGGATNTRDHTGPTPGATEARSVAANALTTSLHPTVSVGTFPPARRAPPWGLSTAGGTRYFSVAYKRKYSTRVSSTALL